MKRIVRIVFSLLFCMSLTGCFKRDNFEGINIYTTVYPIEYIVERLYGEHSNISSIYPDGVDINDYELTEKQITDYSKTTLFTFNGLGEEKKYVNGFFQHNKRLKIIDTTSSMEYLNGMEELWLDPSNFLMMVQNVRYGLKEYINNHYLKNEIDEKYNKLKEEISKLDADIYEISDNSSNKTLIVSSDLLKFLEKYNFTVISLEENENLTEKTLVTVENLINDGSVHYIILLQGEEPSETIKKIIEDTNIELVYFHLITNLTGEERNLKKDYISLMSENIDLIRNEVYD